MDQIINDSKTRRTRGQRDLEKSQPMTPNSQYNDQCETVSQISTPANAQSHQNFPNQKEKLASTVKIRKSVGSASANANAKRKSTQNYIEKNKKELESLQQAKQSSRNIYTQHDEEIQFYMKPHQTQVIEDNGQSKKIKAKVNSGLQRSKSQVGKMNSTKKVQNILDMTPKERLQEDLKWNVTKEAKQEINDVVNSRYAQLEHELFQNMNGKISEVQQTREDDVSPLYNVDQRSQNNYEIQSQDHDNTPKKNFIDDKIKQIQERNGIKTPEPKRQEQQQEIVQQQLIELLDYQVAPDEHIQQVQEPQIITQTKPKAVKGKKKKSKKPTPLQVEEPKSSEIKTPSGIQQPQVQSMTRVKTARNNLRTQAGHPSLKQDTKERPKSIVKQKVQTAPKTPTKDYQKQVQKKQIQTAASKPSLKVEVSEKKPFQSKTNQGSKSTKAITNKSIKIEDTISPLNIKKSIERIQTQEDPREVETFVFDNETQINYEQKEQTQSFKEYNLSTKEDFLNFNIENIWKEMEEIGRSKQAAHELFDQFQNNYYDKKQSNLFDKLETSPTKRFVQIKNATAKHHVIESKKGIKDSTYMIQYTTCPDKSYVVKPDGGEIKYDNYPQRRTNKLVQKIIDGTVEKIKLKDSPVMSPKKKYMINSPVKITSKHCKRVCDEYSQDEEEIMQQQQQQEQEQIENLEPYEQFSEEKQIEQCEESNDNDEGNYYQYQQNVLVEGRK